MAFFKTFFLYFSEGVLIFYRPVEFLSLEHVRDHYEPTAEEERWGRTRHQRLGVTLYANSGKVNIKYPQFFISLDS